jgi:hypothetical protein
LFGGRKRKKELNAEEQRAQRKEGRERGAGWMSDDRKGSGD